jgi:hypothetical protein
LRRLRILFLATLAPINGLSARFGEFGKKNNKSSDTLRDIALGEFQQFFCKPSAIANEPWLDREKDRQVGEPT